MRWPFPALVKADEELNSQPSLIKKPFELEELAGLCDQNHSPDPSLNPSLEKSFEPSVAQSPPRPKHAIIAMI